MSMLSPEKLNSASILVTAHDDDEYDMTFHDPPSSPFVSHLDHDDQENIAPTPVKSPISFDDEPPMSAFKVSPEKKSGFGSGLKDGSSPVKGPVKKSSSRQLLEEFEEEKIRPSSSNKSPVKDSKMDRPESAMSSRSRRSSPTKSSRNPSADSTQRHPASVLQNAPEILPTPSERPTSSHKESALRENEGLTVAMKFMEETRSESRERSTTYQTSHNMAELDDTRMDDTEFNPDGPELSSLDIDDTCFSAFSEMPGVDMTKFAVLRNSPTRNGLLDQVR
jgi:hypothetical protein